MKNILILLTIFIASSNYSQNQILLDESWFIHAARNSNASNAIWDDVLNTDYELRFEIFFFNDKIVMEGCCGGIFEMDVNYIGDDTLQILNITEIETIGCNENFVFNFYNAIKGAFNSMVGETIEYQINNNFNIFNLNLNNPINTSFVSLTNIPIENNEQAQAPYWGHEPPNHQWSLTHLTYQGQSMELPYGAALTIADIYEGTFTISLCGEIFIAINSSWELDVEELMGPCFISCGILENITDVCAPVAGYDIIYLENFKQSTYDFLNNNVDQIMYYTFTSGDARKLIIEDFSQNKLIFHSNENYLNTTDFHLNMEVFVYPNPVMEFLFIYSTFCNSCEVKIYSPNGKLLNKQSLIASQGKIDVKQLSNGIYFLVIENEQGIKQTKKFVKK